MSVLKANETEQIFYFCKNNQLTNLSLTMGDIYDKYKQDEGWLEIEIQGHSIF